MTDLYPFIKNLKRASLLLLFMACSTVVAAQTPPSVNITVNIFPPYSPYYSDYAGQNAGKVLLIVQNLTATPKTIKLAGQLTGDNGIKISTKSNYVPLQPITLNPNETKQLNGMALKDIFDLNSLNVYGVDKSRLIYTSRLPEGNYNFCVQALDFNNGQLLSTEAPLGCTNINILYPESPMLISPIANSTALSTTPQQVIFNWSAAVAPTGFLYLLQVAEMPLTATDPNQVFSTISLPLVSRTVMGFSTILGIADPPLILGKRYAWRVQVYDPQGKVVFKNNGFSNAQQFRYGSPVTIPSVVNLITPEENRLIKKYDDIKFSWSFTDNSEQNDKISFMGDMVSMPGNNGLFKNAGNSLSMGQAPNVQTNNKYIFYLVKVKTPEQKAAENRQAQKVSMMYANGAAPKTQPPVDNGIAVPLDNESTSFNKSYDMMKYITNGNTYEWYVKHVASGTVSQKRAFTFKMDVAVQPVYTLTMNGNIKYNFADRELAGTAQQKNGYAFSKRDVQLLRVSFLAPLKVRKDTFSVTENGVKVKKQKDVKYVDGLNTLKNYPYGRQSLANTYPVVATTQTDSMGNFKFSVPIDQQKYKVLDSNIAVNGIAYAMVEGLVIKTVDGRFSDPNWFIYPTPGKENLVLGTEKVQIGDFYVDVKFKTTAQRDYKGTLYLLRDIKNVVLGEGDGSVGETKDITTITGQNDQFNYMSRKMAVVGKKKINALSDVSGALNTSFRCLVRSASVDDNYTIFFEPDDQQDALYFSPQKVSNTAKFKYNYLSTQFSSTYETAKVEFGPKFLTIRVAGRYLYNWKEAYGKTNPQLPLPEGTELKLVKGYLAQRDFFKDGSTLKDQVVIKTTYVKKNGEYSFDLGMQDYEDFNKDAGKSLVIMVSSPYYNSAPNTIIYNQKEDIKVPDLVATVKQYVFKSRVASGLAENKGIGGMTVYLCRAVGQTFVGLPVNEGDPDRDGYFKKIWDYPNGTGPKYQIIDKTLSAFDGSFTFNRLVAPSGDPADTYYIFAEPQSTSPLNYVTEAQFPVVGALQTASIFGIAFSAEATMHFTDQQQINIKSFNKGSQQVPMVPLDPYIDGAVYPYSNTSTSVLSGALVEMFDMVGQSSTISDTDIEKYLTGRTPRDTKSTGSNGRFLFEKFPYAASTGWKLLRITKTGFLPTYKKVNNGNFLTLGMRGNLQKVYMNLPLDIKVRVVDADNGAVGARVVVGDDFSWGDTHYEVGLGQTTPLKTPKGSVKFTIIPNDQATYKITEFTAEVGQYSGATVQLTVGKALHNVVVLVRDKTTGKMVEADLYVTNARAIQNQDHFSISGTVINTISFSSSGTQFDLRAVPKGNYTIAKTRINSTVAKTITITVDVEPATTIRCSATYPDGNRIKPTNEFNVFVKGYEADEYVTTPTSTGFTISKVPAKALGFVVSATKAGYIGEEKPLWLNGNIPFVDFKFTNTAISLKSIYGFPIELTQATAIGGGVYMINGRLNATGNATKSGVKVDDAKKWLQFKDLKVRETISEFDKLKFYSFASTVTFLENTMDAKIFSNFAVKITDNTGLKLEGSGSQGSITGQVALDPSAFGNGVTSSTNNSTGESNYLYLNTQNINYETLLLQIGDNPKAQVLNTLTTGTSDIIAGSQLLVSTFKRTKPTFKVIDDFAIQTDERILLDQFGIKFNGVVQTALENTKTPNILAKAKFTINEFGISTSNEVPATITLGEWVLTLNTWKLNSGGFKAGGVLNALGLTIPVTNLKLTSKKIGYGDFDVKSLKLLNSFQVTLNAADIMTSFGYDKGYSAKKGAWSVSILAKNSSGSLASLNGLPDLASSDKIYINNINLFDTGDPNDTRIILTEDQPAVTLNDVASYRPGTIYGGPDFIAFTGGLNLDIPNMQGLDNINYDLRYRIVNNEFVHVNEKPFKNLALKTKGIEVAFLETGQQFSKGVLSLTGTLKDVEASSAYTIQVKLDKIGKKTTMYIPQDVPAAKIIHFAGKDASTYLANATGSMEVSNSSNTWSDFKFNGDLTGASGIQAGNSKLYFTIKGDLVADNSKIGVDNMEAGGMSGINITYDFANKKLLGSGHMHQSTSFADVDLDIELSIGGSQWYIFSNAVANNIKNTPFNQLAAGFMVGNADITEDIRQSLNKHFKDNELPPNFAQMTSNVHGVLAILSADMPIPVVPSFDLTALEPVAHAEVSHGIYANLYFKANFSTDPAKLAFTAGARVGAFVKLGVGASIGLACASIALSADIHADAVGSLAPFDKKFSLDIGLTLTLKGSAYVGAGICNSSCETPCVDVGFFEICSPIPCVRVGLSKEIILGLQAGVDQDGFHFKSLNALN